MSFAEHIDNLKNLDLNSSGASSIDGSKWEGVSRKMRRNREGNPFKLLKIHIVLLGVAAILSCASLFMNYSSGNVTEFVGRVKGLVDYSPSNTIPRVGEK